MAAIIEKIFGAPGTGKTFNLIKRISSHLDDKENPSLFENTLTVTFTKVAAREIRNRIGYNRSFTQKELEKNVRTIHSYIMERIRGEDKDICYADDFMKIFFGVKKDSEIDDRRRWEFISIYNIIDDARIQKGEGIENILSFYDRQKGLNYQRSMASRTDIIRVAESYANYKKNYFKMDWTDVLYKGLEDKYIFNPIDVLMLDEAQDCNRLEWLVINKLIGVAKYVYIAGDDDQAIYRFKGGEVETFLKLAAETETVLDKSPRLNKKVHAFSQSVISLISSERRKPKIFTPTNPRGGNIRQFKNKSSIEKNLIDRTILHYDVTTPIQWLFLARTYTVLDNHYAGENYSWSNILVKNNMTWEKVPQKTRFSNGMGGTVPNVYPGQINAIDTWLGLQKGKRFNGEQVRSFFKEVPPHFFRERKRTSLLKKGSIIIVDKSITYDYQDLKSKFYFDVERERPWWEILILEPRDPGLYGDYAQYLKNIVNNGNYKRSKEILFSTIHSAKGLEASNVVLNTDWTYKPYNTYRESLTGRDDELRVFYVGTTRTKNNLYLYVPDFSWGEYKGNRHNNFLDSIKRAQQI